MSLQKFFVLCPIHPLIYITIALILGIFSKYYSSWKLIILICTILGSALIYLHSKLRSNYKLALIIILAFLGGALRLSYQINSHIEFIDIVHRFPCTIEGTVTSTTLLENSRTKQSLLIKTNFIFLHGLYKEKHEMHKNIQVYLLKPLKIMVDDVIRIENITLKNPNNDSFNSFLIKEDIAATAFLTKEKIEIIKHPEQSFSRSFFYFKETVLVHCREKLSDQTFSLFSSIFLGNRVAGKKDMEDPKEQCKTWGISHYLARSGLHLVIFVFAWHLLLKLLPISFLLKEILMLFLSILYFLLSWSSISFIRAFATFIFYKACIVTASPIQSFYLLTLVCFLVLVHNPMQLFFLDFQLSFGLTFALAWFNNIQFHKNLLPHSNH